MSTNRWIKRRSRDAKEEHRVSPLLESLSISIDGASPPILCGGKRGWLSGFGRSRGGSGGLLAELMGIRTRHGGAEGLESNSNHSSIKQMQALTSTHLDRCHSDLLPLGPKSPCAGVLVRCRRAPTPLPMPLPPCASAEAAARAAASTWGVEPMEESGYGYFDRRWRLF